MTRCQSATDAARETDEVSPLLLDQIVSMAVRPRVVSYQRSRTSVHTLLCHRDLPYYLFAIATFLTFSELPCTVFVYDDGSLTAEDVQILRERVKGIRLVAWEETRHQSRPDRYPWCARFVDDHVLAKRLLAVHAHARTERIVILDADVLFFRTPREIVRWAEGGMTATLFNKDASDDASVNFTEKEFRRFGSKKIRRFNAGLVCTHRCLLDLELVERTLEYAYRAGPHIYRDWTMEQTVMAVLIGRGTSQPLSDRYSFVNDSSRVEPDVSRLVCRHYSQFARSRFFTEGVRYLAEAGRL